MTRIHDRDAAIELDIKYLTYAINTCDDVMSNHEDLLKAGFSTDSSVWLRAVSQGLSQIGEIFDQGKLSDVFYELCSDDMNYREWKDFRNVLIHSYVKIDPKIVQFAVENEVEEFKEELLDARLKLQKCLNH